MIGVGQAPGILEVRGQKKGIYAGARVIGHQASLRMRELHLCPRFALKYDRKRSGVVCVLPSVFILRNTDSFEFSTLRSLLVIHRSPELG